jgi:hypothetical protein
MVDGDCAILKSVTKHHATLWLTIKEKVGIDENDSTNMSVRCHW